MSAVDEWVSEHFSDWTFVQQGGQRRVYRVSEPQDSALKVWLVSEDSQHERHVREVSALGRLRHDGLPRVVAYLSQVEIGDQLYAMYQEEWLEAPALARQLDELPLEADTFRTFIRTALETLNHLHEADITHRDISLGNVLWDGEQAYVIDLGLAKHRQLDSITQTHERLPMTRWTASPEQLQGVAAELEPSTDVYSLGIIAFVATTGRHPFIAEGGLEPTPNQYIQRQMNKDFQSPLPTTASFIEAMLEPVRLFRPGAAQILSELA